MKEKIVKTKHGTERIKERLNVKAGKKQKRLIKNAAERGISSENCKSASSPLTKYILRIEAKEDKPCKAKIYQGSVFLFGLDGSFITTWALTGKLYKIYESERSKAKNTAALAAA